MAVEQHQGERLAGRGRRVQRGQRRRAAVHRRRPHAPVGQHLLEDAAVGGVVVHDQHRQAVQVRPAAPAAAGGAPSLARPNRAVKWNVLPWPTSLSTQMRPPIRSTSCAEIVSPRPVPPYLRVVELSACANGSKIAACLLRRDADAGVADGEVQTDARPPSASPARRRRRPRRAR